ncbi:MAG: aminopeptidase P family protein [Alphaproteobacteria bacterium]|nr:aminopeptidase P family protein [Alphaproteobacteria bacterium]
MQQVAKCAAAMTPSDRIAALRGEFDRLSVDGFVVPHADAHQGEWMPPRDERLAWLTGFTGSAGLAVVLRAKAAIFVDGRYTLQAEAQVDGSLYEFRHLVREPATDWLRQNLDSGARLGFDPWLHGIEGAEQLEKACTAAGATLVAVDTNPIDAIWLDQPLPPTSPARPHGIEFAGKSAAEKREAVAAALVRQAVDAAILTPTESTAWLLNIRGRDVPCVPVTLAFSIVHADGTVDLLIDRAKVGDALRADLGDDVRVGGQDSFGSLLDDLGRKKQKVLVDSALTPDWVRRRLSAAGAEIVRGQDPCALPRAIKNEVELAGARHAHERDGAALCRFLAWLDEAAAAGDVTEIAAAARLAEFRAGGEHYVGPSFDTISGAGANGAIVHYRVTQKTNRSLEPGSLYLVDSGAQYLDGTTDVTRTVAIGTPGAEERRRFTQVLRGHIALATVWFPAGTTGSQLDILARQFLWRDGVDYDHGTGHGVGSFLRVHEGPQNIATRPNATPLAPGMILSNEPGYYRTGAYGIRIENLVVVVADETAETERDMRAFETLTLAPIDRNLIDTTLLTPEDRAWVDAYHALVREVIAPRVDGATAAWLGQATAPL